MFAALAVTQVLVVNRSSGQAVKHLMGTLHSIIKARTPNRNLSDISPCSPVGRGRKRVVDSPRMQLVIMTTAL